MGRDFVRMAMRKGAPLRPARGSSVHHLTAKPNPGQAEPGIAWHLAKPNVQFQELCLLWFMYGLARLLFGSATSLIRLDHGGRIETAEG